MKKNKHGFVRIVCTAAIVLVSLIFITCDENNNKDTTKQLGALLLIPTGPPKCDDPWRVL